MDGIPVVTDGGEALPVDVVHQAALTTAMDPSGLSAGLRLLQRLGAWAKVESLDVVHDTKRLMEFYRSIAMQNS